jgi:hypothetical protein
MGQYTRHAIVDMDEVIAHINFFWGARREKVKLHCGYEVGVTSLRMKTFAQASTSKKGIHCKACGLKAQYFAVESFTGSILPSTHVNLYGTVKEVEVLFTQDHVLPKSRGGKDNLNNSQVMCQPCNSRKGARSDRKFKQEVRQSKC